MFPERSDSTTISELQAAFHLTSAVAVKAACLLALGLIFPFHERSFDYAQILAFCTQWLGVSCHPVTFGIMALTPFPHSVRRTRFRH